MVKKLHQNPQTLVAGEFFVKIAVRFFSLNKTAKFLCRFFHSQNIAWQLCFPSEFDRNR
jgi:hypothetical protein